MLDAEAGDEDHEREEDAEDFYIDADEPVFTSGVVARLLDIPVWVLKQLDAEGIVSPPRKEGCSRRYSKRHLKKLEHVWHYISVRKVKISGLKVILEMEEKIERLESKGKADEESGE